MSVEGPHKTIFTSVNYTIGEEGKSKIQNKADLVSQEIFRAKASAGIQYTCLDRVKKSFVWLMKAVFFPITLPADYFIKKFATQISIADKETKKVDERLVQQLQELGGENIDFQAQDGVRLKGMMFTSKEESRSRKTILICSGSHQSQESYNVPIVKALLALGHNVMTFNYRGFGLSDGKASESGLYKDGEAAYQYILSQGISNNDLVVYGYSLGGAIASDLGAKHKVDIVLDRTFSSGSDRAEEEAPKGFKWLARMVAFIGCEFNNAKKLKYVKGNIFIYQENENNRHTTFLERMKRAVSRARHASIESLESSGALITAHGAPKHFHSETNLWFGVSNLSEEKEKLQKFLNRKHKG